MLLIASPTCRELGKVIHHFKDVIEISTFICGVGILNTLFNLQQFYYQSKVKIDKIIFAGIGGGFQESGIALNDICIAQSEILADMGVMTDSGVDFAPIKRFGVENKIDIKSSLFKQISSEYSSEVKVGSFLTVNSVTASYSRKNFFYSNFHPVCENMEGFAAAFLAQKFNIDFIEIRSISNFIAERDNWEIDASIDALNNFLIRVVENI